MSDNKVFAILFLVVVIIIIIFSRNKNTQGKGNLNPQNKFSDEKIKELGSLPVGLEVIHDPNPVKAMYNGRSGRKYTWQHSTTVKALHEDTVITEFGAFSWYKGQWIFGTIYRRPFNAEEFAEWYSCPNAVIHKDESFSDPLNYSGNDVLVSSKAKWYYIGVTKSGKRVKGEAEIVKLPQVKL
ncbi:MAG: hypothetical protein ACYC27_01980 [Armatimonadota bacterium]